AEMIGQPPGDEERIGDRAGAEKIGEHDVANEAGEARHQGQPADREDALDHARGARWAPMTRMVARTASRLSSRPSAARRVSRDPASLPSPCPDAGVLGSRIGSPWRAVRDDNREA